MSRGRRFQPAASGGCSSPPTTGELPLSCATTRATTAACTPVSAPAAIPAAPSTSSAASTTRSSSTAGSSTSPSSSKRPWSSRASSTAPSTSPSSLRSGCTSGSRVTTASAPRRAESLDRLRAALQVPLRVDVCKAGELLDLGSMLRTPEVGKPQAVSDWRRDPRRCVTQSEALIKWPEIGPARPHGDRLAGLQERLTAPPASATLSLTIRGAAARCGSEGEARDARGRKSRT